MSLTYSQRISFMRQVLNRLPQIDEVNNLTESLKKLRLYSDIQQIIAKPKNPRKTYRDLFFTDGKREIGSSLRKEKERYDTHKEKYDKAYDSFKTICEGQGLNKEIIKDIFSGDITITPEAFVNNEQPKPPGL